MLSHSIFRSRLNIGGTLVSGIWSPRHNKRWWNSVCNGYRVIVAGFLLPDDQPVVGVLPQPWSESSMFFWNGEFKMCYLTLTGSFADMILLPSAGAKGTYKAGIFVLSSLDNCIFMMMLACLLRLPFYCAVEYSELIPIADSIMTVAKFSVLPAGVK
ncbi:hypothetical protein QYF36_010305 [Acer negundo]|nr:hypothetical protein QYF36_010305 [Acer negundo]